MLKCHNVQCSLELTDLLGGVSMSATTAPLPSPMGVTLLLKTHVTSSKPGVVVNSAEETTSHPDLTTPSRSLAASCYVHHLYDTSVTIGLLKSALRLCESVFIKFVRVGHNICITRHRSTFDYVNCFKE